VSSTTVARMARWAPDAAVRLERAAVELFAEQGYDATTVPQITERAGLTTRTFFRHFVDKREVLFLREREFPAVVASVLADAPPSLPPMELVMYGLQTVAERDLSRWRGELAVRRDVLRSDERLRERELLKSTELAGAIAHALIGHGVDPATASMVARVAALLLDVALDDWLDGDAPLPDVLDATRARMAAVLC
jgi:AcrR family transcriptional regulator